MLVLAHANDGQSPRLRKLISEMSSHPQVSRVELVSEPRALEDTLHQGLPDAPIVCVGATWVTSTLLGAVDCSAHAHPIYHVGGDAHDAFLEGTAAPAKLHERWARALRGGGKPTTLDVIHCDHGDWSHGRCAVSVSFGPLAELRSIAGDSLRGTLRRFGKSLGQGGLVALAGRVQGARAEFEGHGMLAVEQRGHEPREFRDLWLTAGQTPAGTTLRLGAPESGRFWCSGFRTLDAASSAQLFTTRGEGAWKTNSFQAKRIKVAGSSRVCLDGAWHDIDPKTPLRFKLLRGQVIS